MPSTKKTAKKGRKRATKKAVAGAAGTNTLKLSGSKGITKLMRAAQPPSQFSGLVHYQTVASFLVSGGSALLVMYRPQGNYSPADVGAAASYLQHIVGKDEGDPATVLGYPANLFGQACILLVAAS
jgi:phosphosulfolactate phosphohydrolase-like enzyme